MEGFRVAEADLAPSHNPANRIHIDVRDQLVLRETSSEAAVIILVTENFLDIFFLELYD
jgi:hypothetical protein